MQYSIITGATGVLGSAFCKALASRGCNLFLTGRSWDKLTALKNFLIGEYPSIDCKIFAADLTDEGARQSLFEAAKDLSFNMLVNVAGADIQKPFEKYSEEKIIFQTRINFEAAVSLCKFAIDRRAERLEIINICSVCGLQPMPYFALYSACKGALTDFSVALSAEMRKKNVSVTAIIPGSVYTREDVKDYINSLGFIARKSAKTPEYVVAKSLKAADKGKKRKIIGGLNKLIYALSKVTPQSVKLRYIARSRSRVEKDVF